jgi:hypothetical protein
MLGPPDLSIAEFSATHYVACKDAVPMCQCNKSGLVDLGFGSGLAGLSASELSEELQAARRVLLEGRLANLKPVLPIMLNLKGEPYKLLDHFPFEPFFSTHTPRNLC